MKGVLYHCTQDPRTALRREASPSTVMWVPGVELRFSFVRKLLLTELSCWAPEGILTMLPGLFLSGLSPHEVAPFLPRPRTPIPRPSHHPVPHELSSSV